MQDLKFIFTELEKELEKKRFAISAMLPRKDENAVFIARNPHFMHLRECVKVAIILGSCVRITIEDFEDGTLEPELRPIIGAYHANDFEVNALGALEMRIPEESVEKYNLEKIAHTLCRAYGRIVF